jgi:hypothetical protein
VINRTGRLSLDAPILSDVPNPHASSRAKKEAPLPGPKGKSAKSRNLAVRLLTAAALLTALTGLLVGLLTLLIVSPLVVVVLTTATLLLTALIALLVLLIGHQLLLGFDAHARHHCR